MNPAGKEDELLGMTESITRRDFLNGLLVGAGATLIQPGASAAGRILERLQQEAVNPWTGYGGVGDYAESNGNTWEVMQAAHSIRDGSADLLIGQAIDTGETYDLVVVGGGLSGLGAAYGFRQRAGAGGGCLILDNHPIFGGEAKRNEFVVDGIRLVGPQGSNDFGIMPRSNDRVAQIYHEIGLPTELEYREWAGDSKHLEFSRDNYLHQLWFDRFPSHGFFFSGASGSGWMADPWENDLAGTPFTAEEREDLLRWRSDARQYYKGDDQNRWLDSMTYREYLENIMGLGPSVARYVDPVVAAAIGLGSDVTSAYGAYQISLPGFQALPRPRRISSTRLSDLPAASGNSFPGGNSGIARHFIKALIPDAIGGSASTPDIINGAVNFAALDRDGAPIRYRPSATVLRVEPEPVRGDSRPVVVTYSNGESAYRVKARGVVMAGGGWTSKHIVADLPSEYRQAYSAFPRAPMLVVNVALANWRFLYELGFTACRWFDGFGFTCNIRKPMLVGGVGPPLDPDKPIVLTFYVPFVYPGRPVEEQTALGREELLSKSYRDYERIIRRQLVTLFESGGFDPKRDIAGIVLNRWGHAYVCPTPGFYFGREGKPAPRDIIRQPFGQVAFANSELRGHQSWVGAVREGLRAADQVM